MNKLPMRATLREVSSALMGAVHAIRPVVGFLLGWGLVQAAVLVPLLGWAGSRLTTRDGELAISNYDLGAFLLSPAGAVFLVGGGALNLALIYAQQAGLFLIASRTRLGLPTRLFELLGQNLGRIPGLAQLGLLQLLGFGVLLLPFGAVLGGLAVGLLGEHDINYYLATRPAEWKWTVGLAAVLAVVYGLLALWLQLRWIFAVPCLLLSGRGSLHCLKLSWRATRGRLVGVAAPFAVWWSMWLAVLFVLGTGFTWVAQALVEGAGANLSRLIPVLMMVQGAGLVGGVVSAFGGGVVHQFLLARLYGTLHPRAGAERRGHVKTVAPPFGLKPALMIGTVILALASGISTWRYVSALAPEIAVEVTAHRGSSRRAPENTLSALRQAIADQADTAEIDVQSSRDGRVVLLHDGDLMRVAGDAHRLGDLTLAELRELDIGSWFSEAFRGERIATLEEAIELVKGHLKLNIELKYNRPDSELAGRVLRILRATDFMADCVITSLTAEELLQLGREAPGLRTGLIVTAALGDTTRLPVQFLSVNAARVSSESVRLAHRNGKEVHAWTVNDRASALRLIEMGVDNLITDEPGLMVAFRNELQELNRAELIALALRTRFVP